MLPNKELTLKEFKQIINYNRFDFGGEAIICETEMLIHYIKYSLICKNQKL